MTAFIDCNTSSRQFGFKKGLGCIDSIGTFRKVANYFNERKSTLSIGVIDLKKAFDKCNIYGLLFILLMKNVNISIIRILENWFSKSYSTVKWKNTTSSNFPLISGVKQGGVLSPLLFTLFVDIVLDQLERSKLGCFVNYTCFNSLMYADDIVLLSASVTDLQKMFDICADIFKILDHR